MQRGNNNNQRNTDMFISSVVYRSFPRVKTGSLSLCRSCPSIRKGGIHMKDTEKDYLVGNEKEKQKSLLSSLAKKNLSSFLSLSLSPVCSP